MDYFLLDNNPVTPQKCLRTFLISVVIPVYQSAKTLPSLFSCLLSQSFLSFKILFVYDKSTDVGLQLLRSFKSGHPDRDIQILIKNNKEGVGKARDCALDSGLVDTKYVIFIDSDDTFESNFLQCLFDSAEFYGSDVAMCGFDRIDSETQKVLCIDMVHNPQVISDVKQSKIIAFLNNSPWNKLMKTETVGSVRFIYPGGVSEDEMFFLKFIPRCSILSFVNVPLYHYVVSRDGLGLSVNEKTFFQTERAYLDVKEIYLAEPSIYQSYLSFLTSSVFIHLCVGTVTKISLFDKKKQKPIIKEAFAYLNRNFPDWRKNPYYSLSYSLRGGFKTLMIWRCSMLYKIHLFSLFIFEYSLFIRLFRKDVKW